MSPKVTQPEVVKQRFKSGKPDTKAKVSAATPLPAAFERTQVRTERGERREGRHAETDRIPGT